MRYLLDTNVLSELRKGSRCNPAVTAWEQSELIPNGGAVSVITIGEIRKGIDLINRRDVAQARKLEQWLHGLYQHFSSNILPISVDVAEEWGRLNALRPLPAADSLLCATVNVHGLILATRNVGDIQGIGVQAANPFAFESA